MTLQVLDPPTTTGPPPADVVRVLHPRTQLAARARLTITVPAGWDCEVDPNSYLRFTDPDRRVWLVSPPWSPTGRWAATVGPLGQRLGNMAFRTAQECVDFVAGQATVITSRSLS